MADAPPPPPTENVAVDANASSNTQDERVWERPWSLKEVRDKAGNWSLAGDAGLLLYLQEFSQKLISRTHEIETEVENLVHDSKLTSVRVNNVFNDFMMLANTQFVENRVYDDNPEEQQGEDQTDDKKADAQEKTREQKEAELIPKVSEAIRLGVEVIEKAFEKLDTNVDNSDSEEEEGYHVDPILEAKDPYLDRSLPYLIGTPNFMNDENVGLREISDEEMSDAGELSASEEEEETDKPSADQDQYSYSESESDSDAEPSKPAAKKRQISQQYSDDSDSEGDLFGDSSRKDKEESSDGEQTASESEDEKPPSAPGAPLDFASELQRKLGGAPPAPKPASPTAVDEESSGEKKKKKKKKKEEKKQAPQDDDIFGGPDSDEGDLFSGGTFGGKSKSMFDDSEDEGEFGQAETSEEPDTPAPAKPDEESRGRTSSGKKIPAGGVSMFGGMPAAKGVAASGSGGGGLFDESGEDDDDFFAAKPATKPAAPPATTATESKRPEKSSAGGGGLFDEDSEGDDIFDSAPRKPSTKEEPKKEVKAADKKHHPVGGVPMFGPPGAGNPLSKAIKARRNDSDEEENDDWSDGEKSRSGSIKSNQSGSLKQNGKMSSVQSKDSLFLDDPDDSSAAVKPKSNSFSKNAKQTKGLFDDDDEDDLFGAATPVKSKPADKPKEPAKKAKSELFMDSDEEDGGIFAPSKPKEPTTTTPGGKKPPAGAVSIFPSGVDPFSKTKTPPKEATEPESSVRRPPAKSISMFDDEEKEEADDLFGAGGTRPPPVTNTTQKTPGGKKSIFDDDGDSDLFGGDPTDIFSKPASTAAAKQQKTVKPASQPSSDMFGTDDEDDKGDLFGVPPSKAPASGGIPVPGVTTGESSDDISPKKKRPAGAVSMFGPAATGLVNTLQSSTTIAKPEPHKPTAPVADPLFGEEEEEGDLFSAPKPVAKVTKPAEPVTKETKTVRSGSKGPLDDDSDDDLFSSKPTAQKQPTPEPAPVEETKSRKPVGGVSMFGGMDPFAAMKKSQVRPKSPETITDEAPSSPLDSESNKPDPVKPASGLSSTTAAASGGGKGKIGNLQAKLNFNPAAMLPGAAPAVKEPEPLSVGFDAPAEARTLQSANKDRAKLGAKRRPPSRHARKSAAVSATGGATSDMTDGPVSRSSAPAGISLDFDLGMDDDRVPPPVPDSPVRSRSPDISTSSSKPDLFGNEDMFDAPKPSSVIINPATQTSPPDDDLFSGKLDFPKAKSKTEDFDDLFSAPSLDTKPKQPIVSSDKVDDDDMFASVPKSTKSKDNNTAKTSTKAPTASSLVDDDDDIFAVKKTKAKPKPSPIIEDDDDDIFASSALNKAKSTESSTKTTNGLPDDDIFANAGTSKTKESPSSTVKEDADLDQPVRIPEQKKKKAVTKDEDLFADNTDIFSDIPKSKPKEKKAKKKTTSTAPKKTIFKDDIDDIFADTSTPSKPKEKKGGKKSSKEKKEEKSASVVDDPLMS